MFASSALQLRLCQQLSVWLVSSQLWQPRVEVLLGKTLFPLASVRLAAPAQPATRTRLLLLVVCASDKPPGYFIRLNKVQGVLWFPVQEGVGYPECL